MLIQKKYPMPDSEKITLVDSEKRFRKKHFMPSQILEDTPGTIQKSDPNNLYFIRVTYSNAGFNFCYGLQV